MVRMDGKHCNDVGLNEARCERDHFDALCRVSILEQLLQVESGGEFQTF